MKHLIIYLFAGLAIFSFIGTFMSSGSQDGNLLLAPAMAAPDNGTGNGSDRGALIHVGLLAGEAKSMEDIHFRSALQRLTSEQYSLHICESGSSDAAQWEMFSKMLREGYEMIVLNIFDPLLAEKYVDAALEKNVILIFLHARPAVEVMTKGPGIYYLGFSDGDSLQAVAQQIADMWLVNREDLDHFSDDSLAYSFLSDQSFTESGQADSFQDYLARLGVEGQMARDSVTSYFSFDIHKEIDRIWVANTELIICTSSSDARKSLDYLNDPTEFKENHIQMVLLTADESAQKMVADGEILLAIGTDGQALAQAAFRLMEVLLQGETPTAANIGVDRVNVRFIYVPNTMVRSTAMNAPPMPQRYQDLD